MGGVVLKQSGWKHWGLVAAMALGVGCNGGSNDAADAQAVIDTYADLVHASYSDSVAKAEALKGAVDAFVAAPSAATLTAARQAWLASREPYGQTETYRFYEGPIDSAEGPEGQINAWPLDEAFIDSVAGSPNGGIINDTGTFPTLSTEVLAAQNENGGEKNIATGYHAIEFLLWGQDLNASGPGSRPHTDFVTGAGGTLSNPARRGEYLKLAAQLLVDDLKSVTEAWAEGGDNYGKDFRALDAKEALRRMLQGMGSLSGAELSGERMTTAYDNKDQEDEHSCFSDNTHRDLYTNALGIQNVYLGRYGSIDGKGLEDLVKAKDPALDTKMKEQLAASLAAIEAIPKPFDQAILGDDSAPGRAKVLAAIRALQAQTDTIVEIATALDVQINLE
jgi:putative iron-regulated protein